MTSGVSPHTALLSIALLAFASEGALAVQLLSSRPNNNEDIDAAQKQKLQGNAAFASGDDATAAECYTKAITLDASDAAFYSNRANAYLRLDRAVDALQDAAHAIALRPQWAKAHFRYACALAALSRYQESRAALMVVESLSQNDVDPLRSAITELRASLDAAEERSNAPQLHMRLASALQELEASPPERKLPIAVVSGFLGAGKTTLLQSLLTNRCGKKFAVLVNDMASINIDASLLVEGVELIDGRGSEDVVALSNGCICCTLRDDLLDSVVNIAAKQSFDYLLIEGTGIAG